eukprot:m.50578 g.50578  ORF g.50578 m.50578 type:complete len:61 (-) comp12561_c0_seq1:453-635(-)
MNMNNKKNQHGRPRTFKYNIDRGQEQAAGGDEGGDEDERAVITEQHNSSHDEEHMISRYH